MVLLGDSLPSKSLLFRPRNATDLTIHFTYLEALSFPRGHLALLRSVGSIQEGRANRAKFHLPAWEGHQLPGTETTGKSPLTSPFPPPRKAGGTGGTPAEPGRPKPSRPCPIPIPIPVGAPAPPRGAAARTAGPAHPPPRRLSHGGTRTPVSGRGEPRAALCPWARGRGREQKRRPRKKRARSHRNNRDNRKPPACRRPARRPPGPGPAQPRRPLTRPASPAPSARARRRAGSFPRHYPLLPAAAFERAARAAMAEPPARRAAGRSRKRRPRRAAGSGHRGGVNGGPAPRRR